MTRITESDVRRIVKEELSEQLADTGEHGQSYEGDVEDRARNTLVMDDIIFAEQHGMAPAEVLSEKYGIDAADYPNEAELLADVRAARSERV